MYKKILIALCIAIALFFIVPIVYVLWTREPNIVPFTVKGPFVAIYLKNLSTQSTPLLLHDIKNSEFVLDPSVIWEWEGNNDLISPLLDKRVQNSDVSRKYFNKGLTPTKSILLECNANVPVKFKYEGEGGLVSEIRYFNKRIIKDFDDNSTYWFQTSMEFFKIDFQTTGKYTCEGIEMSDVYATVYVFGKDVKTFITNEQIEVTIPRGEIMTVKCPISDPSRQILLRQLVYLNPQDAGDSRGSDLFQDVDESIILSFDPKIGFSLLPDNWNSYVCVDAASKEESGLVKLYKSLDLVVTGNHLETYLTNIPLPKNTSGLRILCEATENVTLNLLNFSPKFKRKQVYFYNVSSAFPFSSRIILRNEFFLNYSRVECVTTKDSRILRVWKYLKKQWSDKTKFHFDNNTKGYECCTTDADNQATPRLTQATCYTQTECEMKRSCVKLENKCPYPQILNQPIYEGGEPGCALAKVEKNPSGVLECSYGNYTKTYLYFYHPKTGFHNFTSSDFFRKRKIPVNTMLRMEQRGISTRNKVDMITLDCYGPKFFFANGFQWEIRGQSQSGSRKIINQSKMEKDIVGELHESIHLPVADVKGKSVICYAPLLYSRSEWVQVKIDF